ncbi:hypothetical protein [Metamycoplasma canadense]|uniref:Uncharacterized protein n=1 Tax=Metamycoplasma canadense TaxID=29554 RepID=A0A077LBY8_9BACT|nr:hypothetical protein [Metamycoplasma canadense]BAP39639.1 hypothetical protein MCAN360_0522 [Metamycoplasma canadense]
MDKKILDFVFTNNLEINANKLKEEVLSKDFIQDEIKRLNLNDYQIQKGMGILQRYHDFIVTNNTKPNYELYVDIYGFLSEDFSKNQEFQKYKVLDNFWLTAITELDPNIQEYFETEKNTSVFSNLKKTIKNYLNQMISTPENETNKEILTNIFSKGAFNSNIWFWGSQSSIINDILKYICILNGIKLNKTVAYLNANDLYNYLNINKDEKSSIMTYLNKVQILVISNLTLGYKAEWFFDFLINIISNRNHKKNPTLISSTRDILSSKTRLLHTYSYSKDTNENDLEIHFKDLISSLFKKITIK